MEDGNSDHHQKVDNQNNIEQQQQQQQQQESSKDEKSSSGASTSTGFVDDYEQRLREKLQAHSVSSRSNVSIRKDASEHVDAIEKKLAHQFSTAPTTSKDNNEAATSLDEKYAAKVATCDTDDVIKRKSCRLPANGDYSESSVSYRAGEDSKLLEQPGFSRRASEVGKSMGFLQQGAQYGQKDDNLKNKKDGECSLPRDEDEIEEIDPANYGLAVAVPIQESDEEDLYLPAAVEFDPDQKNAELVASLRAKRRKKILIGVLLTVIILSIAIGVTVSITEKKSNAAPPPDPRTQVGIQDIISANIPNPEVLNDPLDPYTKAMNWMMFEDPFQLVPGQNATFLQRYLLAYVYYATSVRAPWDYCSPPPKNETITLEDGSTIVATQAPMADCQESNWRAAKVDITSNQNNWLSDNDECLWAGVVCDDNTWQLRGLNLALMGTNGPVPKGPRLFPFLTFIDFSAGNITGTIPEDIGNWKYLIAFRAPLNQIDGTIPEQVKQWRSLQSITLPDNQLSGDMDELIADINKNLKNLYIENNNFNKSPLNVTAMQRLQSITNIRIAKNKFTGTIPPELFSFKYLGILELGKNQFTGTIPDITSTPYLSTLALDNNQLKGTLPETLYNQTVLMTLQLNDNQLKGSISPDISRMSFLGILRLENNDFTGPIPTEIGSMTNLIELDISKTEITGSIPNEICNLRAVVLATMTADCYSDSGAENAQIFCPIGCCTSCCSADGTFCTGS